MMRSTARMSCGVGLVRHEHSLFTGKEMSQRVELAAYMSAPIRCWNGLTSSGTHAMVPRKHVPPPTWRYAGALGSPRVTPTAWVMRAWPTLRQQPPMTPLAQLCNRDVYAVLLSQLFHLPGDDYAFPHAFTRGQDGRAAGCHWRLLPTDPSLPDSDPLVRGAVRDVFTLSRTQALPLPARQALWQLHAGGLPVGPRTGGDGFCPIVDALRATGLAMSRVPETHAQIAMQSPVATLVWRHLATAWSRRYADAWSTAVASGRVTDAARRAVLLGLRPQHERSCGEPFALLRGLAVATL